MTALEERRQPNLFKLKLTKNVKRHITRIFNIGGWYDSGRDWEGKDGALTLIDWKQARRAVVIRCPIIGETVLSGGDNGRQLLGFIGGDRRPGKEITGYEYALLVSNTDYEILSLGQLYRDRADAKNVFDELMNQWGWGEFTAHDLHRCQLLPHARWR